MEQKGGVFSHQRPHSPEYARVIKISQKRRQLELAKQPELEELPTEQEAESYLHEHGLDTSEKRLQHEHYLAKQLGEATFLHDTDQTEALRRQIWMMSNHIHKTLGISSEAIETVLKTKIRAIKEAPIEYRGESAEDIRLNTTNQEHEIQTWASLLGVLRQHLTGEHMMRALKAEDEENTIDGEYDPLSDFEYRYNEAIRSATHYHDSQRKRAKPELENLRLIRDRLYYNLLFPNHAATAYRAEQNWKREHRRSG